MQGSPSIGMPHSTHPATAFAIAAQQPQGIPRVVLPKLQRNADMARRAEPSGPSALPRSSSVLGLAGLGMGALAVAWPHRSRHGRARFSSRRTICLAGEKASSSSSPAEGAAKEEVKEVKGSEKKEEPEASLVERAPAEPEEEIVQRRVFTDEELFANDGVIKKLRVEEQPGVTAPLGFFDPLGFTKDITLAEWRQYRGAEVKHGRIAMLATVGAVAECFFRIPDFHGRKFFFIIMFRDQFTLLTTFTLIGFLLVMELAIWTQEDSRDPGDFGDPLGIGFGDDEEWRNRELNNGRFAMFASLGILAAQFYTGKLAIEQLGFDLPSSVLYRNG